MRTLLGEQFRITRQYSGLRREAKEMVYKTKALNQPAAEKTGTTGQENA
jgi:hypothetical protein